MKRQCRIFALFTAFILIISQAQSGYAREKGSTLPSDRAGQVRTATDVVGVRTAETPVLLEGSTLYTYATPIVIKKDTDGKTYVFNGLGTKKLLASSVGSLTIYGGGKNETVEGNVSITVEDANMGYIYGGGYSDGSSEADVIGDVSITVKGSANAGTIYGGGAAEGKNGDARASVTGKAEINIPAVPTGNHGNISGGGRAVSFGSNNAYADVGASSIYVNGRTYSARGGGSASLATGASGRARADVKGEAKLQIKDADIREVYGGGSASGSGVQAKTGSVDIQVNGNEVMLLRGGGDASSGACADVSGKVSVNVKNCSNLYGYLMGGGSASGGGSADTGSVDMNVESSVTPVVKQFGAWTANAFYGGGEASGDGSQANVNGSINMNITGGEIAGNVYGGGEASNGGSAQAGDVKITLNDTAGYFCEEMGESGEQCYPTVFGAGSSDKIEGSSTEPKSIDIFLSNSTAENLWGGVVDSSGSPGVSACISNLTLKDSEVTRTVTCFDKITLNKKLTITAFLGKKDGEPTWLVDKGVKSGEVLVSCADRDSDANWFSLKDGELEYEVTDTASVWKVKTTPGPASDLKVDSGDTPKLTVTVADTKEVTKSLLTEEDKQDMEAGDTIGFELHANEETALDGAVRQAVDGVMTKTQSLAASLDIQLFKIRNGAETIITETPTPLRFSITVSDEFRNHDSRKTRKFSIIRVHEQEDGTLRADMLEDLDDNDNTVTVETDKFSIYSLVYEDRIKNNTGSQEKDKNEGKDTGNNNNENNSGNGKTTDDSEKYSRPSNKVSLKQVTIRNRELNKKTDGAATGDNSGQISVYGSLWFGLLLTVVVICRRRKNML